VKPAPPLQLPLQVQPVYIHVTRTLQVPEEVKPEFACPSEGMDVPISPYNLVPSPEALPKPPMQFP
jgi:hypothetical protein